MRRIGKFFLAACLPAVCDLQAFTIAERGRPPECAIVVTDGTNAVQRFAAEELQGYVKRMTGVEMPIAASRGAAARAVVLSSGHFEDDGFRLRTTGDSLLVEGGARTGVLYGVYELLEKHGGCGWFTAAVETVPETDAFTVPDGLDAREKPAFMQRDTSWYDVKKDRVFAARMRLNGVRSSGDDPRLGGVSPHQFDKVLGNCHTFDKMLPAKKYFKDHPEWYSLVNGVRTGGYTQPCLTNPDVERLVLSNVLARIRANPGIRYFGVSQNDTLAGACECPSCKAIDDEEGSHSGTMIRFVNRIAEAVEKEYPDVIIETLAYHYTRKPPKHVRPRRNVMVCLSTIECDFSRPFDGSRYVTNKAFLGDLRKWSDITSLMYVWDYTTSYRCYLAAFPNVQVLAANLRTLRSNGVTHVYDQGNGECPHGWFAELKTWLISKLEWNPDQPLEPLLDRFFKGYYGAAAPFARKYFDAVCAQTAARNETKYPLTIGETETNPSYPPGFFHGISTLWDEAMEAVKDDPLRREAARWGRFASDYTMAFRFLSTLSGSRIGLAREGTGYDAARREEMRRIVRERLLPMFDEKPRVIAREGGAHPVKDVLKAFAERSEPPKISSRLVLEEDFGKISNVRGRPPIGRFVDDPAAEDGRAVELLPGQGWSYRIFLLESAIGFEPGVRVRLRIRARVAKVAGAKGEVMRTGVHSSATRRETVPHKSLKAEDAQDGYVWYDIGSFIPTADDIVYVSPGRRNPDGTLSSAGLFVDRFEFSIDGGDRARVREGRVELPEYAFSDPDPVPPATAKRFPYFRFDGSSPDSKPRSFKTVEMSNGRISLTVLPEVGGKVWGATDLETGFDFIYRNHAAKFRNVAMRGPWWSGGIEFNFGVIGHSPCTSTPVDYAVRTNDDGSVSCFVSMVELICRTAYQVEVRLAPGESGFTTRTLWYNPAGLPVPYYHWMNAAVHAEAGMELKFDGKAEIGHQGDAHPWPVDSSGRQLPLYSANAFGGNKSYHVVNGDNRVFGVWYPARGVGMVHENEGCDKYGRKAWIWALSREGAIWEDLLTDSDGQYVELQSGRGFNQPRFDTVKTPFKHPVFSPGRTDRFTERWGVARVESEYAPNGLNPPSAARERPLESPAGFDWNGLYGRYLRGQQAVRERDDALGESELRGCLSMDPNYAPALVELAFLMIRRGRYGDAIGLADRALAVDTYDGAANFAAGFAAFAAGDDATAKERLGLASYSAEYRNASYATIARIALREMDWKGAVAMSGRVLAADPANRDALLTKVVALRNGGRRAQALEAARAALSVWPLFHEVRREMSLLGAGCGWVDQVRNEFPEETMLEMASWYRESGLEADAREIELAAGDSPVAKIRLGDYAAAARLPAPRLFPFRREDIPALDRAVAADPSWKFKYYRAVLAISFQDSGLAERLLDACGNEPDDFSFYLFRASRRKAGARLADLRRAAEISSDWRIGRDIAAFHAAGGDWDESAKAAALFLERNPGNNPLQIAYARALVGCRRWRDAIEFLKGVNILPSEFGDNACDIWQEAWRNLGDAKMADSYPENLGKGRPYGDEPVRIEGKGGSAEISLDGATILSYVPAGGSEALFRSSEPSPRGEDDPGFNGGVPVCWPWVYNDWGARRRLHGFAHRMRWRLAGSSRCDECVLVLEPSPETRAEWPHDFRLEYRVSVRGMGLECTLTTINTGGEPFSFSEALHPYFRVGDLERSVVKGLPGGDLPGREHVKGIYPAGGDGAFPAIADGAEGRTVSVSSSGAARTVVWNCGKDPMRGYAEGEWRRFVCVEPANNLPEDAIRLAPGGRHELRLAVRVDRRNGKM